VPYAARAHTHLGTAAAATAAAPEAGLEPGLKAREGRRLEPALKASLESAPAALSQAALELEMPHLAA
jgi:hypothetical protein